MIPETPRVLFIADAGPEAGGGHLMRSLTLAEALSVRGAACAFLATPQAAGMLATFAPAMSRIDTPGTDRASLAAALAGQGFDALVFDHYRLARPDHEALAGGRACLVIDDLADRPLGADIVLDSGPASATWAASPAASLTGCGRALATWPSTSSWLARPPASGR